MLAKSGFEWHADFFDQDLRDHFILDQFGSDAQAFYTLVTGKAPSPVITPASRQHQRRREHRPVRDPADHIVHLVVPRFTGEPRAGQQYVIAPEQSSRNARRARYQDQPRTG